MAKKKVSSIVVDLITAAAGATVAIGAANVLREQKNAAKHAPTLSYADPFRLPVPSEVLRYNETMPEYVRLMARHQSGDLRRDMDDILYDASVDAEIEEIIAGPNLLRFVLFADDDASYKKLLKMDLVFQRMYDNDHVVVNKHGSRIYVDIPMKFYDVELGTLLSNREFSAGNGITLALGMGVDGTGVYENIEDMPHLLIAGSTGSGKTVLMHSLILSVLMKHTPKEVELYMIDPKETEFSPYAKLGYCHVVSDPVSAVDLLGNLCVEMDRRYNVLANAGVVDLASYNEQNPNAAMPRLIVFVDELADIMNTSVKKIAETYISRLSAKARAAGIHLVLATQYPTVEVITGQIKANITARIALNVATRTNSMVILDRTGAETLQKHGDLLYMNGNDPVRLQAPYVSRDDVNRIVDALATNQIIYQPTIPQKKKGGFKKVALIVAAALFALSLVNRVVDRIAAGSFGTLEKKEFFESEWDEELAYMCEEPEYYVYILDKYGSLEKYAARKKLLFNEWYDGKIDNVAYYGEWESFMQEQDAKKYQIYPTIDVNYEDGLRYEMTGETLYDVWGEPEEEVREERDYSEAIEAADQLYDWFFSTNEDPGEVYYSETDDDIATSEALEATDTPVSVRVYEDSFDELHVAPQYYGDVYYNTDRGGRIEGIDEFYYVNEH